MKRVAIKCLTKGYEEKLQDLIFDFTDLYKDFADNQEFKKDVLGMMFDVVMEKARNAKRGREVLVFKN